jgi:DNA-binding NarL/FixJ family response regulator
LEVSGSLKSSITDNQIFIVGKSTLQNSFLALSLEKEIGHSCSAVEGYAQARSRCEELPGGRHLILYDCMKRDMEICLKDLNPPFGNGSIPVSFFNMSRNTGMEENAVTKYGIRGFFYVDDSFWLLAKGVRTILGGELWVSRHVLSDIVQEKLLSPGKRSRKILLSAKEKEILTSLADGATNQEIADTFCVSKNTLRNQMHTIFQKLKVRGRVQAAIWAVKNLPSL